MDDSWNCEPAWDTWSPQKMAKKGETPHVNCLFLNASHQIPQPICHEKFVSKSAVCCFTISWATKNNPLGANNLFTVQLVKFFLVFYIFKTYFEGFLISLTLTRFFIFKTYFEGFPEYWQDFLFSEHIFWGISPNFLTNIHINSSKNRGSPRFQHLRRAGGTWGHLR